MPEDPTYPRAPFFSFALWTSFQLSLQSWTCGLFSWVVAGDKVQSLLSFGAFFSFSVPLTALEMNGNYSNTEKYHSECKSAQQQSLITSTSITPRLYLAAFMLRSCAVQDSQFQSSWNSTQNPVPHTGSPKRARKTISYPALQPWWQQIHWLWLFENSPMIFTTYQGEGERQTQAAINSRSWSIRVWTKQKGPSQQTRGSIFHIPCSTHSSHSQQWLFHCCCSGKGPYLRRWMAWDRTKILCCLPIGVKSQEGQICKYF